MIKPWEALNRDDDVVEAKTALDSIADVSNAGYRRGHHFIDDLNRIATVILLPLCVLLGGLSYYLFQQAQPPPDAALPPLASPAVGVLIPNEANAVVAPNAQRQAQGFLAAFARHGLNEVEANKHIYRFNYPFKSPSERAPGEEDTRQRILEQFQTWYDDGKRVFIITVSGAITAIREDFIEFAERQPENDRPVLVATVASAPGLASRRRGVFRHYIRSEDEAALLSAYVASLRSKARAVGPADTGRDGAEPQIAVFYVLDEYGKTAKDILLARHPTAMPYDIAVGWRIERRGGDHPLRRHGPDTARSAAGGRQPGQLGSLRRIGAGRLHLHRGAVATVLHHGRCIRLQTVPDRRCVSGYVRSAPGAGNV